MEYIFCLSYYAYAAYIYREKRDFLHPAFLFCSFWAFINSLTIINLFNFYAPSDFVFILSFLGGTSFFISFLLYNKQIIKVPKRLYENTKKHSLRKDIFHVLLIITSVYMLYRLFLTLNLLLNGKSLDYIRRLSLGYDNSLVKNKLFYLYNAYINKSLIELVFPIIGCTELVKNKNYKYLLCSLILTILNTVCTGGRFALYYFVILVVYTTFIYFKDLKEFIIKNKKTFRIALVLTVILLICITMARSSINIFSHLYSYFCGAFYNLSVRLDNLDSGFVHTYGVSSFLGPFRVVFLLLDNLNIIPYPDWFNYAAQVSDAETFISLSETIKFNAYVTPIYSFYLDGGVLGVIIGFFGSGLISTYIYNKFINNRDSLLFAWVLMIILGVFTSMVVFPFTRQNFAMSIFFLLILFKAEKKNDC